MINLKAILIISLLCLPILTGANETGRNHLSQEMLMAINGAEASAVVNIEKENPKYRFVINESNEVELREGDNLTRIRMVGGVPLLTTYNQSGTTSFFPNLDYVENSKDSKYAGDTIDELLSSLIVDSSIMSIEDYSFKRGGVNSITMNLQ